MTTDTCNLCLSWDKKNASEYSAPVERTTDGLRVGTLKGLKALCLINVVSYDDPAPMKWDIDFACPHFDRREEKEKENDS